MRAHPDAGQVQVQAAGLPEEAEAEGETAVAAVPSGGSGRVRGISVWEVEHIGGPPVQAVEEAEGGGGATPWVLGAGGAGRGRRGSSDSESGASTVWSSRGSRSSVSSVRAHLTARPPAPTPRLGRALAASPGSRDLRESYMLYLGAEPVGSC